MKFLIVFISSLAVTAYGAPTIISAPIVYGAPFHTVISAVPASTQWHSQDALGQYSYGYSGGPSAKSEVKTFDGVTSGSYSYVDAENKLQTVNYVSDAVNGFRVAATNLPSAPVDNAQAPVPVEDTAEVKQARSEHLAAVAKAQNEAESEPLEAPKPVEDTEEVKQARSEHLQAVEEAKARSSGDGSDATVLQQTVAVHGAPVVAAVRLAHGPVVVSGHPGFSYSVVSHPHVIAI
jgi:Insect cuticle protein